MKNIVFIIISFFFLNVTAQEKATQIEFCGKKYDVPKNSLRITDTELKGDGFLIIWVYVSAHELKKLHESIIPDLEARLDKFKYEEANFVSYRGRMKGYNIRYKDGKKKEYKIMAYGKVNGHNVMVDVSFTEQVKSNDDLPPFVKKIIRFARR